MNNENIQKTCCKAGTNNFCDKIIRRGAWLEHESNVYCLFHAPNLINSDQEMKYNQLFRDILSIKSNKPNTDIDVRGFAVSNGSFFESVFPNVKFIRPISLNGKTITKSISFENCVFVEDVIFYKCEFEKDVTFAGAIFKKAANFIGCTFNGSAIFDKCKFKEEAEFIKILFSKYSSFQDTVFSKRAWFMESNFQEKVNFHSAIFEKTADFKDASFKLMNDPKVDKNDETIVDFGGCYFNERTYFTLTGKEEKPRTMFENKANFNYVNLDIALFRSEKEGYKIFGSTASFQDVEIDRKLTFSYVDVSQISFKNSFFDKIYFNNLKMPIALYDDGKINNSDMAEQYRRLKQKYINEGNHAEAGRWHLKEKEKQAANLVNTERSYFDRILFKAYNFSSGYGENYIKGIIILLAFTALNIIVVFLCSDLVFAPSLSNFGDNLFHFSNLLFFDYKESLEFFGFQQSFGIQFCILFARIISLIQFGFMSLALRNHFRR